MKRNIFKVVNLIAVMFIAFHIISSIAHAETLSIFCSFQKYSNETGTHMQSNKLNYNFIVDTETNKGFVIGNNGKEPVAVIPGIGENEFTFIEITSSGNVVTTTIASNKKAVSSRNMIILKDIIPSQFYGYCENIIP